MFPTALHLADRFPHALQRMERTRDVAELTDFFAPDAVLVIPGEPKERRGNEGVRHFWQEYLQCFAQIRSEFTHLHMCGRAIILEWLAAGKHADGRPLSYRGVSILAFNPEGKITKFLTYYDSPLALNTKAMPTGT